LGFSVWGDAPFKWDIGQHNDIGERAINVTRPIGNADWELFDRSARDYCPRVQRGRFSAIGNGNIYCVGPLNGLDAIQPYPRPLIRSHFVKLPIKYPVGDTRQSSGNYSENRRYGKNYYGYLIGFAFSAFVGISLIVVSAYGLCHSIDMSWKESYTPFKIQLILFFGFVIGSVLAFFGIVSFIAYPMLYN
jgi:hypothetical protein